MIDLSHLEVWFVTGSQHLYGTETLEKVEQHTAAIVRGLSVSAQIPVKILAKPVMTTAESIEQLCRDANNSKNCIGLVTWMHTFSPSRMWIGGLKVLSKPLLHLHTQFNAELPWATIDMDFMNLNQSAHGDREFGHLAARMGLRRKVVVGFWRDDEVLAEIGSWARAACAWHDWQHLKVARFGDNMRNVAVTEGNKVSAQIQLGYTVNGYGVGDIVERVQHVADADVQRLTAVYDEEYMVAPTLQQDGSQRQSLHDAARIELGLRHFLQETGSHAFTDTFEDLRGLMQLPGIAVQRLMADGYGFGAEGDWKTAALVRAMKVMSCGLSGGVSFMEDYTYHLSDGGQVLGAHMLEVCPSIAAGRPSVEIHPLSIGGKADPVRLVFTAASGMAVNASVIDMGSRFRLLVNIVKVIEPKHSLPRLPVARAVWIPQPTLRLAAKAWILAGGAHHTALSPCVTSENLEDFAEIAGMECILIDGDTRTDRLVKELKWNDVYYRSGARQN